jgi:uncharacterized membrane protein
LSFFAGGLHVVAVVVALVVAVAVVAVVVVVVDKGRLFLGRREIFKFGLRRCDDETLVDRRTPLSLFARLLALLAILAHAVVHQVVTSPTAIQVGTLRKAEDAQLAHVSGWTK